MTCEELEALVFSGRALTEEEMNAAQAHAETCEACRVLLEQMDVLSGVRELDADVEVPESFKRGWRAACREKAPLKQKVLRFFRSSGPMMGRAAAYACCAVLLVGAGSVLGSRQMEDSGTAQTYEMNTYRMAGEEMPAAYGAPMARSMPAPEEERKIVRTADVELETAQLEETVQALCEEAEALGGSVTSREISGETDEARTAYLELRVPAEALDGMLSGMGAWGSVTSSRVQAQDKTEQYADNASRLESARAQKAQLDALYEQAENMEDIIRITDALFDVQLDIDRLSGMNQKIDHDAALSRLHVTMTETKDAGEQGFFRGLASSFRDGMTDFVSGAGHLLEGLVYALPTLAAAGLAGWGIFRLVRKRRRR